jgi:hypothetical protein
MKYLLAALLILSTALCFAQRTYDTVISNRNVRVTLPAGYQSNTNKYPAIIFYPGLGECLKSGESLASGRNRIASNGPHRAIAAGYTGVVNVDGQQVTPIFLTIQTSEWQPAHSTSALSKQVCDAFRISDRYATGLSAGGWTATGIACQPGFENFFKAIATFKGNVIIPGIWRFAAGGGKLIAWQSGQDGDRGGKALVDSINRVAPGSAFFIFSDICGAGHDGWSCFYGAPTPVVLPSSAQLPNGIAGLNVYSWLLRQGTAPTPPPPPLQVSIVASADTITLPADSVTLTAYPTEGFNYSWKQISGPTMAVPLPLASTVKITGLQPGRYTFEVTVSKDAQAATRQININVLPSTPYTILATYLLIQYPNGAVELKKQ